MSAEAAGAEIDREMGTESEGPAWSKLAIATFALSLASPLAILHYVFWPIVLLTAVFAIAAVVLATIGRGRVRGGGLACAAIFLSVFFLSLGIARMASSEGAIRAEARAVADEWFKLVQEGKLDEAHQKTISPELREGPEIPLADAYRLNSQLRKSRDLYFLQQPLQHLANHPENTIRFIGYVSRGKDDSADSVRLRYRLSYKEENLPREVNFSIDAARYFETRFEDYRWVMRGITHIENK